MVPMIDIHTIGAGGGSIAYIDPGGAFKVGPASAGSQPGPPAYGRGGERPTVTDANLVLGRLDEDNFLGGSMALDVDAARKVIGELANAARPRCAEQRPRASLTVVNNNMANAIRSRTVQKGIDPREFALVAFGGAGPLHGAEVAAMLGISEVIVPPYPGITSAMGLLTTDIKYDSLRTAFLVSADVDFERLNRDSAAMRAGLEEQFRADGFDLGKIKFYRSADARYVGQGYELRVAIPDGPIDAAAIRRTFDQFRCGARGGIRSFFRRKPDRDRQCALDRRRADADHPQGERPGRRQPRRGPAQEGRPTFFRRSGRLERIETASIGANCCRSASRVEGPGDYPAD